MKAHGKRLYLLRHGPKGEDGEVSVEGKVEIEKMRVQGVLPEFVRVYASSSSRAVETARRLTGTEPEVDERLGYYQADGTESDKVNEVSKKEGVSFLRAALEYGNDETRQGIWRQAERLRDFVGEVMEEMKEGEAVLAISHDMTIEPAMKGEGGEMEEVEFLGGYVVDEGGEVERFRSRITTQSDPGRGA